MLSFTFGGRTLLYNLLIHDLEFMNSLFLLILKDLYFWSITILDLVISWQFVSFRTWNLSFHVLIVYVISAEKFAIGHSGVDYMWPVTFFLKILNFSLGYNRLWWGSLLVTSIWCFISLHGYPCLPQDQGTFLFYWICFLCLNL